MWIRICNREKKSYFITEYLCSSKKKPNNAGKLEQQTATKYDRSDWDTKQSDVKVYLLMPKKLI